MGEETKTTILGEEINAGETTPTESTDDNKSTDGYLQSLVGEGKKYSDVEQLAKAYANADPYITELRGKVEELEAAVAKSKTVEDIISKLKPGDEGVTQETVATPQEKPTDLDAWYEEKKRAEQIESEKKEEADRIRETQNKSWSTLAESMCDGDLEKAKQLVGKVVGDDSNLINVVNQLGSYSPDKFVGFIKSQLPEEEAVTFIDDVDKIISAVQTSQGLTWSACKKVKQDNPRLYRSQSFQMKMQEAETANANFFNE